MFLIYITLCVIGISNLVAKELSQKEREKIAAELIPIYAMLLLNDDKSEKPLPIVVKKTGQTKSYRYNGDEIENANSRDDGHYQAGVDFNYTRDDVTQIVTDHVTGRQWADDIGAKLAYKQWLTDANYDAHKYNDTSGDTATTFCKNLDLGGYKDWRLPTRKELRTLVEREHITGNGHLNDEDPNINSIFNNTAHNIDTGHVYWTSTTYARPHMEYDVWTVGFIYGRQFYKLKDQFARVRCVRIKKEGE